MLRGKHTLFRRPYLTRTLTTCLRAFLPVTDGNFITGLPSVQLGLKQVNGRRLLVSVSPSKPASTEPEQNELTQP